MTNPEPKKSNLKSVLIIIVTLVILFVSVRYFSTEINQVKTVLHDAGPFAFIVAIFIYGILGATVVPSEPLTALLGGLYSPWKAMLVAMLGNTLAALVEYYLGGHSALPDNWYDCEACDGTGIAAPQQDGEGRS